MTTESGSDSESKDKEQDQQQSPAQQGAAETQPQEQQQPPSEEHPNAVEQFSAVAAHSTPVKKEQVREPGHAASCWPASELQSKGGLRDEAAAVVVWRLRQEQTVPVLKLKVFPEGVSPLTPDEN